MVDGLVTDRWVGWWTSGVEGCPPTKHLFELRLRPPLTGSVGNESWHMLGCSLPVLGASFPSFGAPRPQP